MKFNLRLKKNKNKNKKGFKALFLHYLMNHNI